MSGSTARARSRLTWYAAGAAGLLLASLAATPALAGQSGDRGSGGGHGRDEPKRVVFIVLDQLRPDFIRKFDMKNVQALMRGGTSYPNAYLGHMASETVISHNVMTSGQLPKNMGWSDEWFRDRKVNPVLEVPDGNYVTGSMSQPQFDALIQDKGYPKLADYLHMADPGSTVATVGTKGYATYTYGGPGSDIRLTLSSRNFDCDTDTTTGNIWRGPTGPGVPAYISTPTCNRFYLNSNSATSYGTATTAPAWMYPLDGNRDYPGTDRKHLGGDIWVTDAAFKIMDKEDDWSGMLLTYAGIDKTGHMWGGLNDVPRYPGSPPVREVHMANMARIADQQVGRVIAKLKHDRLLDETLVVLTTDHAQQQSKSFYGINQAGRGNFNWYYGSDADETYRQPSPEIVKLINGLGGTNGTGGNVRMSMQDSAVRTWLNDPTTTAKRQAADVMATLGGVRASYYLSDNEDHYVLRWRAPRSAWTASEWSWWQEHGQEIVDTAAAPYGPDVIGLLADDTNYGVAGDHGGAQKPVQRIPIVFYGAGVDSGEYPRDEMRSVDILPTILKHMDIRQTHRMDGKAYRLP